ncbi:hypothetical protein RclHR1_04390008 [Rhizophagus clarus]|uniref:Protein kinase domain-containing protein n=1 Tax=Rhizophagus clarus TaxID=94130 RepID=A0A2Z6RLS7_9GLOM|nr:hypothetical protein RclHR1_04390008 [Rhizophagus clarus]
MTYINYGCLSKYSAISISIPYDRFYDIEYIAKSGFGKVYRTKWIDGYIEGWDNVNQNWKRCKPNEFVALKSLNDSENVIFEFINDILSYHKTNYAGNTIIRVYGITQDQETKDYLIVMKYAAHGKFIKKEIMHRDLHIGNILKFSNYASITDMGLCKPVDYIDSDNTKNSVYGVLPYIAPEILRGQNYTKAADNYSFGIIMYEVIAGLPPYHDISHDRNLAIKICQGLRPRPIAEEIHDVLFQWWYLFDGQTELQRQIKVVEEINKNLQTRSAHTTNLSYETHSEAIYTSRLLYFDNLLEPKNSDDYYDEQNDDNIISVKFSDSLQIDII